MVVFPLLLLVYHSSSSGPATLLPSRISLRRSCRRRAWCRCKQRHPAPLRGRSSRRSCPTCSRRLRCCLMVVPLLLLVCCISSSGPPAPLRHRSSLPRSCRHGCMAARVEGRGRSRWAVRSIKRELLRHRSLCSSSRSGCNTSSKQRGCRLLRHRSLCSSSRSGCNTSSKQRGCRHRQAGRSSGTRLQLCKSQPSRHSK